VLLRLLTYNIHAMRDDGDAVVRVIRSAAPDVVCIQESQRFLRWRSHAAALARRTGLLMVTGGRPAAGNLLLTSMSVDVEISWDVLLTPEPGLHRRGAAVALLSRDGVQFGVAGTHLDLREAPRLRHVAELRRVVGDLIPAEAPSVLAGDVNAPPGSPSWTALTADRVDVAALHAQRSGAEPGLTYSAAHPQRRIDGIFAGAGIEVQSCEVLDSADTALGSDHRPVLAQLRIG
jgi:endonuclease/exonuclease/phosphatase family metal-dependent hydrolase